jgi:hypothetical protein
LPKAKIDFKKTQKYGNLNPNVWKFDLKSHFLTVSNFLASWSGDVGKVSKVTDVLLKDLKSLKSLKSAYGQILVTILDVGKLTSLKIFAKPF